MTTEEEENTEDPLQSRCFSSCSFPPWYFPAVFYFVEVPAGGVTHGIIISAISKSRNTKTKKETFLHFPCLYTPARDFSDLLSFPM